MDDPSSTKKKKKKRARSLIFKNIFGKSTNSSDTPDDDLSSSCSSPRISASDDNLVYCDVTPNPNANPNANADAVDSPDQPIKKSSSSRGRMSRLFKAVLFDTAMKKKMRKKSMKASSASCGSSPIPYDLNSSGSSPIPYDLDSSGSSPIPYDLNSSASFDSSHIPYDLNMGSSFNENLIINSNIFDKVSDVEDNSSNSNDRPTQTPLSPKAATPVAPSVPPAPAITNANDDASPAITTSPQISQTERKLTSRVDSMKKKPPLPPYSRVDSIKKKPIPATKTTTTTTTTATSDRKPANNVNNPKARLFSLIVLGLFVTVVIWTIYAAIATEPSEIGPEPYADIVTTGDEL